MKTLAKNWPSNMPVIGKKAFKNILIETFEKRAPGPENFTCATPAVLRNFVNKSIRAKTSSVHNNYVLRSNLQLLASSTRQWLFSGQ